MADALQPGGRKSLPESSDQASNDTAHKPRVGSVLLPLGGQSRALMEEYFAENESFRVPPVNPAVVFTEGQISIVLRMVADETAQASNDMLQNPRYRASRAHPGGLSQLAVKPIRRAPREEDLLSSQLWPLPGLFLRGLK